MVGSHDRRDSSMNFRRTLVRLAAVGLAGVLGAGLAVVPAEATTSVKGQRSLAAVLTSDGNQFDKNWYDYDIVTEAVLAVLAAKPSSAVAVLADGSVPLTAFLPNDRAFQVLVHDLTHKWVKSEKKVFTTLAGTVGIDTIESVLLYHVVPGATITAKQAVKSDGAKLATALPGATIKVDVRSRWLPLIVLKDADPNDANPWVNPWALDINKGNRQIAHGITLVLRPADL